MSWSYPGKVNLADHLADISKTIHMLLHCRPDLSGRPADR